MNKKSRCIGSIKFFFVVCLCAEISLAQLSQIPSAGLTMEPQVVAPPVVAEPSGSNKIMGPPMEPIAPARKTTLKEDLFQTNKDISIWFDELADSVDLYLVGKRVTTKPNTSRIVIENTTYSRESRNFVNLTTISVLPRFPNLEAYWNLKFTSYDEKNINNDRTERGYARSTPRQNYAATVGFFRRLRDFRLTYEPRIELRGAPELSHFLTVDKVIQYKSFQVNPKLRLFASALDGTGVFHSLNFNFDLTDIYSLTWLNEGEYQDLVGFYSTTHGLSLSQAVSSRSAMAYGVSVYSNNHPNYHIDAYTASVTWSQVVYKNILDYQISPHIDFVEAEDFRGYVGIIFSFRVYF